jgi:hypothetical protein
MISSIEGNFTYFLPSLGWKDLKNALPLIGKKYKDYDSRPFDECFQEFTYVMEDGSEADATLIMNPNDGAFLYTGSESSEKLSYTVDAKLATDNGVFHVNLRVDCS